MKMDSISLSRLPRPMDTLLLLLFLVTPDVSSEGSELFSCDFENDLCGLIQGTDDHFDWTRHQGPAATGPSEAYHGEHYIYAEANNHPWQGANLRTRNLDYQGLVCVTFAYYMNGQDYHYLRISIPSGDNIATIRNDQGNHWNKFVGRVTLAKGNGIEFRASIPNNNKRDIAVDDLVIRAGSCKDVVSLPYHCSFESGLCGMTQGFDDQFDWTRYNRSTGSSYTGPRNASDGEWFIYIEVNTPRIYNGYTAVIETPAFNHTGTLCLRFNYHMYGKQYWYAYNVGTLIALHEGGTTSTGVFVKTGHMGNTWLSAAVNVTGFQPGDWITFRATRGNSIFGDIAVDNINIATGGCRDCHIFNGSCQHLCIPESTGDRCACHHGYRLDGDTMCTEIDECFENTAGCSQLCDNTVGGFTCHCNDGFRLGKDNSTCQDIDECATDHECQQQCVNTAGSYSCTCGDHYVLATDDRHCLGCTDAYQLIVRASQGFTASCETVVLLPDVSLPVCLREACDRNVSVAAFLNSACDLKRCEREDLTLAGLDGQKGWDVYALNNTWVERVTAQPDGSSLWKILVGVGLGSVVILAVVVLVVVITRRRRMTSPNDEPAVTYENDNVGPSSDVTRADDPNNPPEAGVYQEINTTGYVNMSDRKSSPTIEYQNDVVYTNDSYQDLGPNRQPLPDPYDTLNE